MSLTQQQENEILVLHQKTRSPFKTAQTLDIELQVVFDVLDKNKRRTGAPVEHNGGLGRPEMVPFTVARRLASDLGWDNKSPEIAKAREDYAAGTHEMATGRDGAWLIMYSIPRKRVDKTRGDYFLPECQ